MAGALLRRLRPSDVEAKKREPVEPGALQDAGAIVEDVRRRGEVALRHHAERLGEMAPGDALVRGPDDLRRAHAALPPAQQAVLERTAARIRSFAEAQRNALAPMEHAIPGGTAGHVIAAVERAGCYAPGGRYPLPSSVLMTAVTARVAGVPVVWVASPRPSIATLAAAHVAGADALLAAGGAQAIAALAFGAGPVPAADVIAGPGNRWVTAAKHLVSTHVRIDMLAGASECVVLADESASASAIAADLLAQAEHDADALPILVTTTERVADDVERELARQLETLPTAPTARLALANGYAVIASGPAEAVAVANRVAPEHLELHVADPEALLGGIRHYGMIFIGHGSAEVLGDYGAGPNHVLPTGGSARFSAGLNVFTFLRVRTWMRLSHPEDARELVRDAIELARMEGLEAHARAAELRLGPH